MVEMKAMQDTLQLKGTNVLAAPKTWTRDGGSDPLKYRAIDLEADSPEYKACVDAFEKTLKNPGGRMPNDKLFVRWQAVFLRVAFAPALTLVRPL